MNFKKGGGSELSEVMKHWVEIYIDVWYYAVKTICQRNDQCAVSILLDWNWIWVESWTPQVSVVCEKYTDRLQLWFFLGLHRVVHRKDAGKRKKWFSFWSCQANLFLKTPHYLGLCFNDSFLMIWNLTGLSSIHYSQYSAVSKALIC